MDRQILQLLQAGATSISNLLLKSYKRLSLSDEEMMLIIHLLSFQQEGNRFPTLHQLEERLSMSNLELVRMLQHLMKAGFLAIDEYIDPQTGLRHESYNLEPLYERLAAALALDGMAEASAAGEEPSAGPSSLYARFEQAFGRPLSPFEMETLQIWKEEDRYPDELILTALREAMSVGKLYIKYIDRILLEWQKQQITNAEEARAYSLRFRRLQNSRDSRQPL
ncbi:DnaD domain protein [Brevibacillus sp. SYP-B805]|uniref:DnaD domain-containing protein n=1 Tax=Brevibacillus sp. SYP-B805 TaxID=1578199 RepID=UPI0013E9FF0D|nr:DnaD domain protein [Brevibacillus sp. SYP-B805]NGQ97304.1 DnaD domain protein [Brevibacillus sp. SYP-B805]